jgi:hypothetical protein
MRPTVSDSMRAPVEAGPVRSERRRRWVSYALEPDAFTAAVDRLRPFAEASLVPSIP